MGHANNDSTDAVPLSFRADIDALTCVPLDHAVLWLFTLCQVAHVPVRVRCCVVVRVYAGVDGAKHKLH